jgi:BatD DUF11 like domain
MFICMKTNFLNVLLLFGFWGCAVSGVIAQINGDAYFTAELWRDSFHSQEIITVTYNLFNADLQRFEEPDFSPLVKLPQTQTSSSISVINGQKTTKVSYVFKLKANAVGRFSIPAASVETSVGSLKSNVVDLVVSDDYRSENFNNDRAKSDLLGNSISPFGGSTSPFGGIEQFFNNPDVFNFDIPNIDGFNNPLDFNNLWPEFDKLYEQQFKTKPRNNNPKLPPGVEPKVEPKATGKVYKL